MADGNGIGPGPSKAAGWRPATRAVRAGTARSRFGETSEAIFLTSGYAYDSPEQAAARMCGDEEGFVYTRYGNPTTMMLAERLAAIEGAEAARITGSGMGAISASLLAPVQAGDRVVGATELFGSCRWLLTQQLPRMGVETELVANMDREGWERALSRPAKLVLVESPSNPLLSAVDIPFVAELAHAAGAKLIVDNVFATPVFQKPLELGADLVTYSATKHMDGQGRVLAGAILGAEETLSELYDDWLRHTGPAPSPFNSWVVLKGLETLELRVREMSRSAAHVADRLAEHPAVKSVRYPGREDHPHHEVHARQMTGGGTLIALEVAGGRAEAFAFLKALELVDVSNNLGDAKTLACHPSSTTHRSLSDEEQAAMGLGEGWIRLSVGLEDPEDLADDLLRSLNAL